MGNFPSQQGRGQGRFGPQPPYGQPSFSQPGYGPQGFGPQGPYQGVSPGGSPHAYVTPPLVGQQISDQGYPSQGYTQQGYSPKGYSPQGYPPHGYPPQSYPPQDYLPQGYPPQGYPPQFYPGPSPVPGMGETACCASCLACLTCLLCSCCNALMGTGMQDEGEGAGMRSDFSGIPGAPVAPPPIANNDAT